MQSLIIPKILIHQQILDFLLPIKKVKLSPYSTEKLVCVGCPTQMKSTQKIWNVHAQRKDPTPWTQRNLYSTGWRWGFASGETQIIFWGRFFQIPTCWYPNAKLWRRGLLPNANPRRQNSASQWNIGFNNFSNSFLEKSALWFENNYLWE